MRIPYLNLKAITSLHLQEIQKAIADTVESGWYLQGQQNRQFESSYADYCGSRYCVGCANGLDALTLTLRSYIEMGLIDEGDEVIVPANTYIASILAITENRLTPVFVEPRIDTFQIDDSLIEQHVSIRTRAVMIVNLYGRNAYTEKIADICRRHGLLLVIDNAQGHGLQLPAASQYLPHLAVCHSFYPGKNLGALGDGGAITTDDDTFASLFRTLANYGSKKKYHFDYRGRNSRLDELQAAVLNVKLRYLDSDNSRRRSIAQRYINELSDSLITLPSLDYWHNSVFHVFPILTKNRDNLQHQLANAGIETIIHYPVPPHRQPCLSDYSHLSLPVTERIHREELSLPCHPAMTDDEVSYVISVLNEITYVSPTVNLR